jgi:hypothetical protein
MLVEKYKTDYPFSTMMILAISYILGREYQLVKGIWLKKVSLDSLNSNKAIQKNIQFQLNQLRKVLKSSSSSILGPLSKKLLKIGQVLLYFFSFLLPSFSLPLISLPFLLPSFSLPLISFPFLSS